MREGTGFFEAPAGEGSQYFVNNIEVRSLDEDRDLILPEKEILEKIKLKPEEPYNIIQQGSDRSNS